MTDIIANAKQLLDGATPGPWVASNNGYIGSTSGVMIHDGQVLGDTAADTELIAAAPENTQALAAETWEYQVQTRTQRMPTWVAITDDTLQKWYPEDKYNDLIRKKRVVRGGAGFEIRVLRRRVSEPEVINE